MTTTATTGGPIRDAPPAPMYIDTQHEDLIHDAQMDYYGSKLATTSSGTYDNSISPVPQFVFLIIFKPV
jgi:hypothetical protein